jgi:hypothetical protein
MMKQAQPQEFTFDSLAVSLTIFTRVVMEYPECPDSVEAEAFKKQVRQLILMLHDRNLCPEL